MAFSAAGTSASTSAASERLQGKAWTRAPSLPVSASSASRRVPETATVAPCVCRACAIAPPIPPLAPVTRAVLPVRSNITSSPNSARLRRRERVFGHINIAGPADRNSNGAFGDPFDEPGQHLARTDFEKPSDAVVCHIGDGLAPTYRAVD